MGIENFTEVMDFVYLTGSKVEKVTGAESPGGKKIVVKEKSQFIPVASALPGLIKAIPHFVPELKDMDQTEKQQFIDHAKATYKLENEKAQLLVEKTIEIGLSLWLVVKDLFKDKEEG